MVRPSSCLAALLALGFGTSFNTVTASTPVDDRTVTVHTAADVAARRAALIDFIWGVDGFPAGRLLRLYRNDSSPVDGLENLKQVDTLVIGMEAGQLGYAHHFIPIRGNNRAVVLHHGHACTFNDDRSPEDFGFGLQRTLNALLVHGYAVITIYMPHHVRFSTAQLSVDDCVSLTHDDMFSTISLRSGSPLKFFLEPTAGVLNYLEGEFAYEDYSMVGLSGGGWTTAVYAALDPRIKLSVQVAGSMPLYLQKPTPQGDAEQTLDDFYRIAGYPDLYVLGSAGTGRRQVQILNRRDTCCFGEAQHNATLTGVPFVVGSRDYEREVRVALFMIGQGAFRLEIDETAPAHMISWNSVINQILPELNGSHQLVGAAGPESAFVRGANGNLWYFSSEAWLDTGLPMIGSPSVLEGTQNAFDVFFRSPANRLMHAYPTPAGWTAVDLQQVVASDPVAVAWGNRIDVVALDTEYRPTQWWSDGMIASSRLVSTSPDALGIGRPALVTTGGRLHMFVQGRFDRSLHHLEWQNEDSPKIEVLPSKMLDFPTGLVAADGSLRAYVRGNSNALWEAARIGATWQWTSISAATGATLIRGTPSASTLNGDITIHAQMAGGSLGQFRHAGSWQLADAGGVMTGSPTSTGGVAQVRGRSGGLWLFDGRWISRSGVFY
jgi:hypothetical protein